MLRHLAYHRGAPHRLGRRWCDLARLERHGLGLEDRLASRVHRCDDGRGLEFELGLGRSALFQDPLGVFGNATRCLGEDREAVHSMRGQLLLFLLLDPENLILLLLREPHLVPDHLEGKLFIGHIRGDLHRPLDHHHLLLLLLVQSSELLRLLFVERIHVRHPPRQGRARRPALPALVNQGARRGNLLLVGHRRPLRDRLPVVRRR
mmetsp:Transcript_27895/g.57241  ORF Transcript_27895/g.57241 Transcript_27895/m.57241 type:complete len:206 (+) Transcript_27895:2124-2741(+)